MDIEIRTIADDEFEAWMDAIETAFGGHVRPEEVAQERSVLDPARCLAAIDDGEIVGCASSVIFTMTVPGGAGVPTVGVTGVGVKPTHRRRGVNTGLMRRQLDDARQSGETVAALFASEGGIYGRFGYGLASLNAATDLETARSTFIPGSEPTGRVRMFDRDAARDQILSVWDRARVNRPGMMAMDTAWFDYQFADKQHGEERRLFFAVHDSGEAPDAFAVYHVKSNWDESIPKNTLEVYALDALGPDAYASMWRFVLDVDLIQHVTAWGRPSDEPLLYLLREPRRLNLRIKDALWVRLVDLPAALAARRYAAEGRLVLEVRDAFCSWNDGRFELDAGPDGASCRPTTDEADLVLTVNELAAAYLGGATLQQLHRAGRVHEERAGALALADAMFRWDPAPWCPLFF